MRTSIILIAVFGLLVAACSSDTPTSAEYEALQQENVRLGQRLAETQEQLVGVTAERDALASTAAGESSDRYERALATQQAVQDILDHPSAFGTDTEVVELLASHATAEALVFDDVFGVVSIEGAWHDALYGAKMDAVFDAHRSWLSDDGSQGGTLWTWHGTNVTGHPFELSGISLTEYDERGLITREYVLYPYPDDYVAQAVAGGGTVLSPNAVSPEGMFVFGEDDLCERITEEQVTDLARDAYASAGVDWSGTATVTREWVLSDNEDECEWALSGGGYDSHMGVYGEPVSMRPGMVIAYEDLTEPGIPISGVVTGHPAVDDHVMISNHAFGRLGFWIPASSHELVVWWYGDVPGDESSDDQQEDPLFVVANGFLEDMNWTP